MNRSGAPATAGAPFFMDEPLAGAESYQWHARIANLFGLAHQLGRGMGLFQRPRQLG